MLVVVVALDLKDNVILGSGRLARLAPDQPLGPGRALAKVWSQFTWEHGDRPAPYPSINRRTDDWLLGAGLRFPSAGEVVVDAEWEFPAGNKMDRAETPLSLSPGSSAVLVMRETGKPRLAVQFLVVSAVGQ